SLPGRYARKWDTMTRKTEQARSPSREGIVREFIAISSPIMAPSPPPHCCVLLPRGREVTPVGASTSGTSESNSSEKLGFLLGNGDNILDRVRAAFAQNPGDI